MAKAKSARSQTGTEYVFEAVGFCVTDLSTFLHFFLKDEKHRFSTTCMERQKIVLRLKKCSLIGKNL